ncbi:MAG: AbrB/MazE/SpoVT family DNA-binding domain-containing protein [Sphingomonas sp.]
MTTKLSVTAKGQVTFRKDILEHLGVRPGDKIAVEKLPGGRIAVRADKRAGKISDAFCMLARPGQPVLSIEQINEAIERGWAGER